MTDTRLQAELHEAKAELQRLKDRIAAGTQAVLKDLSSIALFPKWSGSDTGISLEEFQSNIENTADLGQTRPAGKQDRYASPTKLSDAIRIV
jgi:hypothetical protein